MDGDGFCVSGPVWFLDIVHAWTELTGATQHVGIFDAVPPTSAQECFLET
jgi:hypothetical protein